MTDLALLAQPGQRFYGSFEGNCIVRSVQLIDVDALQPQPLQASFERPREVFGAGIMGPLAWARALPSALGRDDQSGLIRIERLGDQLFRCPGAIGIRGVNQVYIELDRPLQSSKGRRSVRGWSPDAGSGDAHRAIAHTVDGEIAADGQRPSGRG